MKLAAFLFGLILVIFSCSSENDTQSNQISTTSISETPDKLFAQIGFEDKVIDLGKLVTFEKTHIIRFTNEGDTTLVLEDVYTNNDLIEVYSFTYEIEPGDQGKIRVKVNSDLAQEAYTDFLFIKSNNNNTSSLARLELKFELSNDLVIGGYFIEEGDRVNVRMFPSLEATVLFGLEKGDSIECIGAMHKEYVDDFDSDLWYYVDYNGRKGWLLSALTEFKKEEVVAMVQ